MNRDGIILITGAAGFIGSNLVIELLKSDGHLHIVGLDNLNDYYDISLKQYRLEKIKQLAQQSVNNWTFIEGNLADKELINTMYMIAGLPAPFPKEVEATSVDKFQKDLAEKLKTAKSGAESEAAQSGGSGISRPWGDAGENQGVFGWKDGTSAV